MLDKGLLASFPDPLLSEKFFDFAHYPVTHTRTDSDIDDQIAQAIYQYRDKAPLYYQGRLEGDEAIHDLEQFIGSEQFATFKSELDSCILSLIDWTNEQTIEILSEENEIQPAEFLFKQFLERLKGDIFSNHRTKLYGDGKKILKK